MYTAISCLSASTPRLRNSRAMTDAFREPVLLMLSSIAERNSGSSEKAISERRSSPSPIFRHRYCSTAAGLVPICRAISLGGNPARNSWAAWFFLNIWLLDAGADHSAAHPLSDDRQNGRPAHQRGRRIVQESRCVRLLTEC